MSDDKPLATFALFAYNQEAYIREAIEGALAQTYEPLEIILSDDCSMDRTFDVMREMVAAYRGPHRLVLRRNPVNVGIAWHVNQVFGLAKGGLIVVAAGDDISASSRVVRNVEAWVEKGCPEFATISSGMRGVTEDGGVLSASAARHINEQLDIGWMVRSSFTRALITGASAAYTPDLISRFGAIPKGTSEDQTLAFRSVLAGQIIRIPDVLVDYRHVANSMSSKFTCDDTSRVREYLNRAVVRYSQMLIDYRTHCARLNIPPDLVVEEAILRKIQQSCRASRLTAEGWVDRVRGVISYPVVRGIKERLAFFLRFYKFNRLRTFLRVLNTR